MRAPALGLAALLATAGAANSQAVDTTTALRTLTRFAETCEEQGRAIWGHSLCGPMVLVHPPTRAAIASASDPDGQFTERAGGWFGTLPADLQTANTAVSWGGDRWTMVLLPLPASEFDRMSLLGHEAFHRVQAELGLSATDGHNPHLDEEQGRLWLRMELRALAVALGASTEDDAREAVRDALAFRAHRHRLFPGADSLEPLLERHEGLAEYTGVVYASRVLGGGADRVVEALAAFEDRPSFVRSFAYATGPALGLLLDRYAPGWREEAGTVPLARMLTGAVPPEGRVSGDSKVVDRARSYGYVGVAAAEAERAEERAARLAEIRRRLIEGPTLVLRQTDLRASFNPNELVPLEGEGTYYPTATFQAAWGRLEVTGGALVAPDWQTVRVSAEGVEIEPDGRVLTTDGWRLELAPGWAVVEEPGGLRVVPEDAVSAAPTAPDTAPAPGSDGFVATLSEAAAALGAGEDQRARELLRAAHGMVPGDPRVLVYLARTELAAGDTARAMAALDLLAAQGAERDLYSDPVLGQLRGRPRFEDVVARMHAGAAPLVRSDTAFALPDPDFLPEGIAHDPVDDVFYVGSLHRGTIVRVDRTGEVRPFVNTAPAGRALVLGVRVDAERRRLWATTLVVDSSAPRFRNGVGGRAALHAYDLDGGALLTATAPTDPGPHLLNDIAITLDGDVYVTDSEGAALYRLVAAENRLERVHGDALNFTYPNGITGSVDGARLYLAHVEGISTVELGANTGSVQRLSAAPGIAMGGIDGLYACRDGLLAVQSLLGFQRVVLLHLDESGRRIVRQEPLEQALPAHDAATTGALAHGALYYIANAQLGRLDADQRVTTPASSRPSVVLRLPVPAQCQVASAALRLRRTTVSVFGAPDARTPGVADSLDSYLRASVGAGFSGVVLVAHGDDVLLHRAYSENPAITSATAFWIGSLTKPFTAMSILKLQEHGQLSVADPISRHISEVPADKRHISIHHLLTHTSGLGHRYASEGIVDRERAIQTILELPIENTPGEYAYSNDGYSLLAALISMISGQSYEQFVRQQILRPAGMEGCGFWGTSVAPGEAVVAPIKTAPKPAVAEPNWGYRGASGLRCTAEDLYRWHLAIQGEAVLSRFSEDVMFAPHVRRSSTDAYGYGWQVLKTGRGTRLLTHTGGESGLDHYSVLRYYADEDVVVVLLSNAPEELTWETFGGLLQTLFRQLR